MVNKIDGSSILGGVYYNTAISDTAIYIMKLSPTGDVVWSKKIFIERAYFSNFNLVELDNGDIVASFFPGHFSNDIRIVKLNPLGDLVWAKSLALQNFQFISDLNTYTDNNKIYLSFNSSGTGVTAISWNTTIIKIDENADVVWSKFYSNTNGDCFNAIPAGIIKSGDSLIVLGRLPGPPDCQQSYDTDIEQSYYSLKVSDANGALGKSVNYSLPQDIWYLYGG
ncbi:MAG: hypothetical protein ABI091_24425, partial [Ferruginibacter sp.]